MKRIIKFRAKTLYDHIPKIGGGFEIPQGTWVYGYLVRDLSGNLFIDIQGYNNGNGFHHSLCVDENTIGQFTGLHDKDGKEIYEGDIIQYFSIRSHIREIDIEHPSSVWGLPQSRLCREFSAVEFIDGVFGTKLQGSIPPYVERLTGRISPYVERLTDIGISNISHMDLLVKPKFLDLNGYELDESIVGIKVIGNIHDLPSSGKED